MQYFGEDKKESQKLEKSSGEKTVKENAKSPLNKKEETFSNPEKLKDEVASHETKKEEDKQEGKNSKTSEKAAKSDKSEKSDSLKLTKEELKEQKKKEVQDYKNLKPPRNPYSAWDSKLEENDLVSYIISKKWLKNWKLYVSYPKSRSRLTFGWSTSSSMEKKDEKDIDNDNPHPGPITNEDLLLKDHNNILVTEDEVDETLLKQELNERYDYKICDSKRAEYLYKIYGGKKIIRKKFKYSQYANYYQTEIIFPNYKILVLPPRDQFSIDSIIKNYTIYISRYKTESELKDKIILALNKLPLNLALVPSAVRLWKFETYYSENAEKDCIEYLTKYIPWIKKEYKTSSSTDSNIEVNSGMDFKGTQLDLYKEKQINEIQISTGDLIVVERADSSGQFIFKYIKCAKMGSCEGCNNYRPLTITCKCGKVSYCTQFCLKRDEPYHSQKCTYFDISDEGLTKQADSLMGLTGLKNLGNSCYMNSGIQCISNCWELTNYFLKDFFLSEINVDNPLGLKGNLVKSWAKLIKKMYFGISPVIEPNDFKKMIGLFNAAFSGYQQQDSHELISYILDGLHEDLNRITKKPIVEQKEYTSTDNINDIAKECLNGFLLRNQSIIVDLFYGQFISTVVCPECSYVSVKADPYNSISLQIVGDNSIVIQFHFIYFDTYLKNKIFSITIKKVSKNSTIADLKEIIAKFLNIPNNSFVVTFLSSGTFDLIFCQEGFMKKATKNKKHLYVFQIDQDIFQNYFKGYPVKEEKKEEEKEKEKEKEKEEARKKEKMKQQSYGYAYNNMMQSYSYIGNNYGGFSYKKKNPDGPDNNHGLDKDCLRTVLTISQVEHVKTMYQTWDRKERITFQRLIFIRRSMTLKELHLYIFKYFRGLLKKIIEDKDSCKKLPLKDENDIKIIIDGNIEEAFSILNLSNSDEKKFTPYKIYLESSARRPYSYPYYEKGKCKFCQKADCSECQLEYTDDKKVQDLLNLLDPSKEIINDKLCYERGNSMAREDKDLDINVVLNEQIDFPKDFWEFEDTTKTASDTKKAEFSLEKLLSSFSIPDKLETGNEWYCPKCKKHLLAEKKMEIYSTPPILVIHFKRFKSGGSHTSLPKKYEGLIDFPIKNLDMSKYTINSKGKESLYDLFAISNHYGELGVGHYTAYALNSDKQSWHEFNDSHVSPIIDNKIISPAAYVLFYKKRDLTLNELADFEKIKNIASTSINSGEKNLKSESERETSSSSKKSSMPNTKIKEEKILKKKSTENSYKSNGKANIPDEKTFDSEKKGYDD